MGWVKSDIQIGDRYAIFAINRRCSDAMETCRNALEESPDKAEHLLRALLLTMRPELAGCVIYWMGFNHMTGQFEIGVAHESLEMTAPGCEGKRMPLFEEVESYQ